MNFADAIPPLLVGFATAVDLNLADGLSLAEWILAGLAAAASTIFALHVRADNKRLEVIEARIERMELRNMQTNDAHVAALNAINRSMLTEPQLRVTIVAATSGIRERLSRIEAMLEIERQGGHND